MTTKMLVSVRSVAEALLAAEGGADFIDLKEPRGGALGGLPIATIGEIVRALSGSGCTLPVSATIGDLPMGDLAAILERVQATGECGVDYVKVGIERTPQARQVLDALAASRWQIVPVFIADRGLDFADVEHAASLGFPGVMVDTADKLVGSLFDVLPRADVGRFVAMVKASGAMAGVAGALRLPHVPAVLALQADFAGFRSAVCAGDRAGELDVSRLCALARQMHADPVSAAAVH